MMEDIVYNKIMTGEQLIKDILQVESSGANIGSVIDDAGKSRFPSNIDKNRKYEVCKTETVYGFSSNSYFHYKIKEI